MGNSKVSVFDEPMLEFRYGQEVTRPHAGLSLFGPYDADLGSHPSGITYGLVGTAEGIALFRQWAEAMNGPVPTPDGSDAHLWPPFVGFDVAFASKWPTTPAWESQIDREEAVRASQNLDKNKRAFDVVNCFLEPLRVLEKRDDTPGVVVCVIPDEIYDNCRPESVVVAGHGDRISPAELKQRKRGNQCLFETFDPEVYQFSPDFRRQLKARAMVHNVPLQLVRESTLRLDSDNRFGLRRLTPLSDRMWNLATTLYYKCGGKPWRLANVREGVCYVGLAYRLQDRVAGSPNGCCAAQMFLDDGDGIVFLGEYGPWYSPESKQFHLSPDAARRLLSGVLQTYSELRGKPLTEVFLHARSGIDKEEFEGFREACPSGTDIVGVRVCIARSQLRLFRTGKWPVLRGTFLKVSDSRAYLWASGFKPELLTADSWDPPVPLRIDIQHGAAPIERVARDILGLSKLNYNECKLGDSQPVTVGFSDAVGEILISNPTVKTRRPNFKFYI